MSQLKAIARNLRLILSREINEQISELERQVAQLERQLNDRAEVHERALEARFEERFTGLDVRADQHETALDTRVDERLTNNELRADERFAAMEARLDERFDERQAQLELRLDGRQVQTETVLDERLTQAELRLDARQEQLESYINSTFDERVNAADARLDERVRAMDNRLDDRFSKVERHLDDRFGAMERRMDARLETHERKTDRNLKQNREDIIDRADIMLQIFEQRIDKQRRETTALRNLLDSGESKGNSTAPSEGAKSNSLPSKLGDTLKEADPSQQIESFRKLSESSGLLAKPKLQSADTTFYQRILDWKKVSQDGLSDFALDEKEVADYILSFITDPGDKHYTMQHMRRLLGTLQRIPPPQSSTDRLLELGSLAHVVPAIKKFCGYNEVCGADVWEGSEQIANETLKQTAGKESHTFELRNFNVERNPFPYPDAHFRVVLCCELIEHLQSDPMHMLWECNRVLVPGGFLLLTTPNIASARSIEGVLIGCTPYLLSQYNRETPVDQHNREYAPFEVGIALAAAGFTVIELETEDVWMRSNPAIIELLEKVNLPTDMRGDNIFALARKTGPPIERYPKELYVEEK